MRKGGEGEYFTQTPTAWGHKLLEKEEEGGVYQVNGIQAKGMENFGYLITSNNPIVAGMVT
jgi:hypothetical protein